MEKTIYTVLMKWNDDGEFDACVEEVFANREAAERYATDRFWEERRSGKYVLCDDDELCIDEEYLSCRIIDDDYWFEFSVCEQIVR